MNVAICVPARNEPDRLPQFFSSLERLDQRSLAPVLCLHLDSCDDDSAAIAHDGAVKATAPAVLAEVEEGLCPARASQPVHSATSTRHPR